MLYWGYGEQFSAVAYNDKGNVTDYGNDTNNPIAYNSVKPYYMKKQIS